MATFPVVWPNREDTPSAPTVQQECDGGLDEATSALDSEHENPMEFLTRTLGARMTILLITHRLSTIRGANVIHVLERGRLVESGDWDALVGRENGRFSALQRAQSTDRKKES